MHVGIIKTLTNESYMFVAIFAMFSQLLRGKFIAYCLAGDAFYSSCVLFLMQIYGRHSAIMAFIPMNVPRVTPAACVLHFRFHMLQDTVCFRVRGGGVAFVKKICFFFFW